MKSRIIIPALLACCGLATTGCDSLQGNITLGVVGATVVGGQAPTHEIEQIYYLGVFDPQDQLPPQVYRVRVHGQSSFLNATKFASGWVPADVIDSLGTSIGFNKKSGRIEITKGDKDELSKLKTGRRLVMFGPEGFREAPAGHRLVVVMGASPEAFFGAIDETLGIVAQAMQQASQGEKTAELDRKLFEALTRMKSERERLDRLIEATETDLPARAGGTP
ncbi:MAG: hypothetical protein O7G83_09035 [Proteobacteria bacterium]|nr:hypothetical protein [Pseudomonadota bacterium]